MCCFKIVLITIGWTRLDFSFDPDIRNKCHSSTCAHLPNGPRCLYTHGHVNILERVEITVLTRCWFCIWRGKKLGKNYKPIRKARKKSPQGNRHYVVLLIEGIYFIDSLLAVLGRTCLIMDEWDELSLSRAPSAPLALVSLVNDGLFPGVKL